MKLGNVTEVLIPYALYRRRLKARKREDGNPDNVNIKRTQAEQSLYLVEYDREYCRWLLDNESDKHLDESTCPYCKSTYQPVLKISYIRHVFVVVFMNCRIYNRQWGELANTTE